MLNLYGQIIDESVVLYIQMFQDPQGGAVRLRPSNLIAIEGFSVWKRSTVGFCRGVLNTK